MSGKIKVTLKKSVAGQLKNIQQSVRGLGLRRLVRAGAVAMTTQPGDPGTNGANQA